MTGFVHADVNMFNITPLALHASNASWAQPMEHVMANVNMTDIQERIQPWNWTASEKISISMMEKSPPQNETFNSTVETALVHVSNSFISWFFFSSLCSS